MFSIEQKIDRKKRISNRKKKVYIETWSLNSYDTKMNDYFTKQKEEILPKKIEDIAKCKNKNKKIALQKEIDDIVSNKDISDYLSKIGHILFEYEEATKNLDYPLMKSLETLYFERLGIKNSNTDKKLMDNSSIRCEFCKDGDVVITDGYYTCISCGAVNTEIKDIVLGFNIETCENYTAASFDCSSNISYERIKYFEEWLKQIQACINKNLPSSLISSVKEELSKERISHKNVNAFTLKKILKKLGKSKYYENIPYIIHTINGLDPLVIPYETERILKAMFISVQEVWEICKPEERHNFFSYPYILHKFCQLLNLNEYLPYFPLLKSREKLYKQDIIWKRIVEVMVNKVEYNPVLDEVKWRFIPSV